jgi:hypothetical protein
MIMHNVKIKLTGGPAAFVSSVSALCLIMIGKDAKYLKNFRLP